MERGKKKKKNRLKGKRKATKERQKIQVDLRQRGKVWYFETRKNRQTRWEWLACYRKGKRLT